LIHPVGDRSGDRAEEAAGQRVSQKERADGDSDADRCLDPEQQSRQRNGIPDVGRGSSEEEPAERRVRS
jgi:hypothetical protein